jgi:hypothetical protein
MMKKKNYNFATLFLIATLVSKAALAWTGYDYQEKTEIVISGGNLVREGLVIEFYDTKADSFHNGKITMMEETSSGSTTLRIEDFNTKTERVFVMMDE